MADNKKTPSIGIPYRIINGKKVYAKKVYAKGKEVMGGRYKFVYPTIPKSSKVDVGKKTKDEYLKMTPEEREHYDIGQIYKK